MDYYKLMGLKRSASSDEIKRAYRKLAVKWHPDQNDANTAIKKFQEIQEAYEVLADPVKKSRYDSKAYKKPSQRPRSRPRPKPKPPKEKGKSAAGPKPKKRTYEKPNYSYSSDTYVYIDRSNMGRSIQMHVKMDDRLREGGTFKFQVKKKQECRTCLGDGEVSVKCTSCDQGRNNPHFEHYGSNCMMCDNMGSVRQTCNRCNGDILLDEYYFDQVAVFIPKNSPSGHMIQVIGAGEAGVERMVHGNLQIVLI